MRSFMDLQQTFGSQPLSMGPLLSQIDTARGKEQLFLAQRPALLEGLSESARVASVTASNAIEGVIVDRDRADRIIDADPDGGPRFRDRSEQEFAGYRDALDGLIRAEIPEPLSAPLILHLHRQLFRHSGGRGGYLKTDENHIVSYERGQKEVVFTPPSPEETAYLLTELVERYNDLQTSQAVHPVILIAGLILDLLAIHPVADGNGRLARLITTHELLGQGYGVARYISLEQRMFESKTTYYSRLWQSQQHWHEGTHDPWPWVTYLVTIIRDAYVDFEERVAAAAAAPTNKQDRVRDHVLNHGPATFRRRDVERALPEVSAATIRLVINTLRDERLIQSDGRGRGARWHRT